jgi:hypothetical protein
MLLSRTHNFIYIHIPKTAGSSMTEALLPFIPLDQKRTLSRKPPDTFGWQPPLHFERSLHAGAGDGKGRRIINTHPNYFVFSIVRNPWDRFASLARSDKCGDGDDIATFFERCIGNQGPKIIRQSWTKPQSWWLYSSETRDPDYMMRFESLGEDWFRVCKMLGIEPTDFPHRNKKNHRVDGYDWRTHYDRCPDYIDKVAELYKEDIERFGYTFDG